MVDLLTILRQRLVEARSNNDRDSLHALKTTFGVLVEAAYSSKNSRVIDLLIDLEDATRDSMAGVSWKSEIPSEDTIRAVFTT